MAARRLMASLAMAAMPALAVVGRVAGEVIALLLRENRPRLVLCAEVCEHHRGVHLAGSLGGGADARSSKDAASWSAAISPWSVCIRGMAA